MIEREQTTEHTFLFAIDGISNDTCRNPKNQEELILSFMVAELLMPMVAAPNKEVLRNDKMGLVIRVKTKITQ